MKVRIKKNSYKKVNLSSLGAEQEEKELKNILRNYMDEGYAVTLRKNNEGYTYSMAGHNKSMGIFTPIRSFSDFIGKLKSIDIDS